MIFDTDILIWAKRGHINAVTLLESIDNRYISVITLMELYQDSNSKIQLKTTRDFLYDFYFQTLPVTENISHRAAIYIEEFCLSHGLRVNDALIAATAIENNLPLSSGNKKHYIIIPGLEYKVFKP